MSDRFSFKNYATHPIRTLRYRYYQYRHFRPWKGLLKRRIKNTTVRMLLDPQDVGISRDLFVYGSREDAATKRLLSFLKPGQIVIDIGANLGYFALLEASKVGESGAVYAIEPAPKNVEILRFNAHVNDALNIIDVTHGAVSDENGSARLHLATRSNLHTLNRVDIMDRYVNFESVVEVPTFKLDTFVEKKAIDVSKIALIRMDIEGHEHAAIAGMSETIRSASDLMVFIEVHPKLIKASIGADGFESFIDQLIDFNFKIVGASASLSSRVDEDIEMSDLHELLEYEEAVELFLHKD